jgi:hypothetical protein
MSAYDNPDMTFAQNIESTPAPLPIREMVQEVFCDPRYARYGPYYLLDENGEELLENLLYEFELGNPAGDYRTYCLQLFQGASNVGGLIWEQEIRTLMRISRLGHPSLPEIITGGYEETPKGSDDFAFVMMPKTEARLNEPGEMLQIQSNRKDALWHFGMLADALSKLHWHGIIHRNLWPGTVERYSPLGAGRSSVLRLVRFEMSTFIENIFRRVNPQELPDASALHNAVRHFIIRQGVAALACCAPERLSQLISSSDEAFNRRGEDGACDVYSLGMIASQWFTDHEPNETLLEKAFSKAHINLDAAEEFRKSQRRALSFTASLPKSLRKLIEKMLDPEPDNRPSSQAVCDEISRNYEAWSQEWSDSVQKPQRLVAFLPFEMGRRLMEWNWISQDPSDGSNAIGLQLVKEVMESDLRDGRLVFSADGYRPFAEGEKNPRMENAKYVLLGTHAAWFCEVYQRSKGGAYERWEQILLAKYVSKRDGFQGSRVNDLYSAPFPQPIGAIEVMPAMPSSIPLLDRLRGLRPTWASLLTDVEARSPKHTERLEFLRALAFLLRFFRIELQARIYPFTKQSETDSVATLKHSDEMEDRRKQKADTALFSFYMNQTNPPRPYFGEFFRSEQTYDDGDWTVDFYADRGGLPEAKPLGKAYVLRGGEFDEVKVRITSPEVRIPDMGWLAPTKDSSQRTDLDRQEEAVQELGLMGSLIGHMRNPHTIRTLLRPWVNVAPHLADDDPEVGNKHGQHFVQELLCCEPFYALHGPPGTGKTTVIAQAIAELLKREPTKRILVSAQSNYALDNLGERIVELLQEPGRVLRVTSEAGKDKVSALIRKCLMSNLTRTVAEKIVNNCENEISNLTKNGQHELAALSREWLKSVEASKPELQDRVRAGANVVLATCSGATKLHIERTTGSSLFDWVIVEEAARAWPTELAIPLVRGFRWALVGDHKQLPAHRITEIERFLTNCEKSKNVEEIQRYGLDRQLYLDIYKFFGGLFKKLEQDADTEPTYRGNVRPLGRMRKQFRMRKPIADVVSEAFYKAPPLLTSPKTEERKLFFKHPPFLAHGKPLIWLDTSNANCDDELSWKNRGEVNVILDLLISLEPLPRPREGPFSNEPLAIVSPYREQNELIKQGLRDLEQRNQGNMAKRVAVTKAVRAEMVHSVHSIQGREADIVIASLVRSGGGLGTGVYAKLGHVADPTLINVLFSRPRLLLIVVGNLTFFETCAGQYPEAAFWSDVCRAVRKNAQIVPTEDLFRR